ncbi:Uncharacterized protein Rs2_16054 [Raphanus sativus]|nr:Uncharacterized protein Rs2_16054 [Raphanus sativus]
MTEVSESEKRADSSSSRSSSPPSRHGGSRINVREDELCDWRKKFSFPSSVVLRIPRLSERASGGMSEEIAIYEAFFEYGFRAIQNLGNEEGLDFGVNEVLFAYHLAPINGHEGRFHLRPRSGLPIVEELPKTDRKGLAFVKKWPEKYVFVTLPGSHYRWNFVEGTHSTPVEGECNVLQARKLPLEQRRVIHLLSLEVLRRSKLWEDTREGSPEDPMIDFKKATDAILARRDSSSRNASGDGATTTGSKRRMIRRSNDFSPSRGGRPMEGVRT